MSLHYRRQSFGPSCPSGGDFYACENGSRFVGCCNADPCSLGCVDGNLEPASFNPDFYGKFPDEQCPLGSSWYTCKYTTPPFMGCCKTGANPCSGGCPAGDLTAGFLNSNPELAAPFLSSESSSSPTTSFSSSTAQSASTSSAAPSSTLASASLSSHSTTASTSTSAALNSATVPAEAASVSGGHKNGTSAIVGGVVGGIAVIAIAIAVIIIYRWKTKSRQVPPGGVPSGFQTQEKHDSSGKSASNLEEGFLGAHKAQYPSDLRHHDQPYPTPTPAYSPGEQPSQSPPGYPTIGELDTPQPLHPAELPSPKPRPIPSSPTPYRPYRTEVSSEGLGINAPSPSHASPFSQPFPSPLTTSETSVGAGRMSTLNLQGDCNAIGSSELSAADSVRVSRKEPGPMTAGSLPEN